MAEMDPMDQLYDAKGDDAEPPRPSWRKVQLWVIAGWGVFLGIAALINSPRDRSWLELIVGIGFMAFCLGMILVIQRWQVALGVAAWRALRRFIPN